MRSRPRSPRLRQAGCGAGRASRRPAANRKLYCKARALASRHRLLFARSPRSPKGATLGEALTKQLRAPQTPHLLLISRRGAATRGVARLQPRRVIEGRSAAAF